MEQIIIAHLYQPTSAATNRIIAYSKAFAEIGIKTTLVLGCSPNTELPNIEKVSVLGVKSSFHHLLLPKMARVVRECYSDRKTSILVYGSPMICGFLPKKK